jgi:hypothetical protein
VTGPWTASSRDAGLREATPGCFMKGGHATVLRPLDKSRLPTLANNCYIIGQARRADVIWSEGDFLALCEHMLNGNPLTHFLTAWADKESGQARFAKATRCRADKRANWAWASITGKARVKTAIGFYPSNAESKSCWAAIDFDAHAGEFEQARKWSLETFNILLQHPQLYLVLCASGNGFHLFIFTRELYHLSQWIVLLKQACEWIGAPIADGVCEIFPNERAESQRFGRGIRTPGTLNPKTGKASLIEAETIKPLLEWLPRTWSLGVGKVNRLLDGSGSTLSLHKRTNNYFLSTYSITTEPLVEAILCRYAIERRGTRNGILIKLVGELIHKFGHEASERIVREHHVRNRNNVVSNVEEHIREFRAAWSGMHSKVIASYAPVEGARFESLRTDHQREGFMIVRAFAGAASHKAQQDFDVSRSSLADRLSITPPGAANVIKTLCDVGSIEQTQCPVRHRQCGRYRWCGDNV